MRCFENYSVGDEEFEEPNEVSYTDKLTIPRIHCAYEDSKQLLCLLQQAFVFEKKLGGKLKKLISEMQENEDHKLNHLELVLLEEIISLCSHKKERTAKELLARKYVSEVKQWQPIVEKGLSFKQHNQFGKDLQMNLRHKWNRIVAVQLFISHCTLGVGYSVTESSINRLYVLLGECPDFTSVDVINNILFILSSCLQKINKTMRTLAVTRQKFKDQATRFFISILTNLTFKYLRIGDRNEDLILLLMGFVTLDEKNISGLIKDTENVNIFKKDGFDPSPGFRAFLLQLFIRHRYNVFKDKISQYLKDTIFHYTDQSMKKELYLLIVQSIEDSHHQRFVQKTSQLQIESLNTLMNNITNHYLADLVLSYEMLEKIATLRFICMHISNWIVECFDLLKTGSDTKIHDYIKKERLIISFKDICLMDGYEYLHVLLLKNIYHQLGSDTLHLITESRDCSWIIPEYVMQEMAELPVVMPDYFIIYGEDYIRITSAVEQVNLLQKKDALLQFSTTNTKLEIILLECIMYSIFQEISRYFYIEQEKRTQSLAEKFLTMKDFINFDLKDINTEVNNLAIQIATNNLGDGHLQNLKLSDTSSNNEIFLIRLIYHVAVMLSCKKYHKLFSPIAMIYENPQVLREKLFPTMMDDQFLFTKTSMTDVGQWYQCPKGHPYFIGECGLPWVRYNCSECGSIIGGDMHKLATKNTLLDLTRDETKYGYLLGRANNVNSALAGERSLSPAAVKIIRVMLDISFIWSSCSKHPITRSQVLPSLVNGGLDDPRNLPNFFYQHLERDVRDLTQLTGKNFEEVIFFLHLIVKSLMDTAGEQSGIPTELTQRELREQWEREFDKRFIQPILSSLHTDVERQMEQVLSEKRIANNPILRIVYEREKPDPNNPLPHLWRYRTIVSVEHFSQSFSTADVNTKDKCPLVDKFLREENKLFVTRYLPDIVQLQIRMREKLLHRLDRREAANTTIKEFLDRIRHGNKQEWEELSSLVNNFATAWSLIGEDVRKNGRLKMEEALEQQEITPATCLAYLLPSSTGEGVLITSLTDYLVLIHNSFVHAYRDKVKESRSDKIPLHELNTSLVIEYEEHLQPLLLSHAHYSLALGQGSHVTYDFEGVEQQFMEQFIQSKPLILAEHLRFEYTREAYNLDVFEQVRHKVQQIELKEMVWKAIQEDLNSLEAVSDVLLVLDVVIGFLSSVGGLQDQKICSYLYDVLRYSHVTHGAGPLQSRKAEAVLCLKHTLSFWTYLSIEKARKLSIVGQIPFSSLRDEFQHMLSQEEKEKIQKSCNYFQVESVLRYLHDFILFFVRERSAEENNFGLRVCMEIYAEEKDCKLPKGFELFPEEITLSQCASTWAELALNIK